MAGYLSSRLGGGPVVNYRGDVQSESDFNALSQMKDLDPARAADMFANWLTGGKPPQIDPSMSLARSAALSGAYQRAGAGRGVSGLFGLGRILGGPPPVPSSYTGATMVPQVTQPAALGSPMQAGVPYSVPPIPGLFKPGAR